MRRDFCVFCMDPKIALFRGYKKSRKILFKSRNFFNFWAHRHLSYHFGNLWTSTWRWLKGNWPKVARSITYWPFFEKLFWVIDRKTLRIPKQPQLAKFAQNLADKIANNKVAHTLLIQIKSILENNNFLSIAITWHKIIQTLQVGVLESSGTSLNNGQRDFEDWCIQGWVIKKNKWANLNDPTVSLWHNVFINFSIRT